MNGIAYRPGLPAWAFPGWRGVCFRRSASPVAGYARVFGCVEGNTTFYRVPNASTVAQWREALAGTGFRFCFKRPRPVTHDRRSDRAVLADFLAAIEPREDHLGPLLVQFPAWGGPENLERITAVVEQLPGDRPRALEVRHPRFFGQPETLEPLLRRYRLDRVALDASALHRDDPDHPEVRSARHAKPDLPVLEGMHIDLRFVRPVLHPSGEGNRPVMARWSERIAAERAAGRASYMMIDCPNNQHCPTFARDFHEMLRHRVELMPMPSWPNGCRDR